MVVRVTWKDHTDALFPPDARQGLHLPRRGLHNDTALSQRVASVDDELVPGPNVVGRKQERQVTGPPTEHPGPLVRLQDRLHGALRDRDRGGKDLPRCGRRRLEEGQRDRVVEWHLVADDDPH